MNTKANIREYRCQKPKDAPENCVLVDKTKWKCHKLLFRGDIRYVEIKCDRCGHINVFGKRQ